MSVGNFGQNEEFEQWSRKIYDIMDEMQKRDFVRFRDSGSWRPAVNVYETRDAYYICVELSGTPHENINVECRDNQIIVKGVREQPRPTPEQGPLSIHAMEIDEGPFWREVDLPESIDMERIEAAYREGYLWITVPRMTTS